MPFGGGDFFAGSRIPNLGGVVFAARQSTQRVGFAGIPFVVAVSIVEWRKRNAGDAGGVTLQGQHVPCGLRAVRRCFDVPDTSRVVFTAGDHSSAVGRKRRCHYGPCVTTSGSLGS